MKVAELVRKHVDTKKFWKLPLDSQQQVLHALFKEICDLYGINDVELHITIDPVKYRATGGGCYDRVARKIYLYKISLMTLLHEIGHVLLGRSERKARMWSHKVFYQAFPELYLKNIREGRFFHVIPLEELERFNECMK